MKIYVRINQRLPHQAFYRCGYKFGKSWRELDVDKATAMRLFDEQMLDVSEKCPAELVDYQDKPAGDISKNQTEPANPQGKASPEGETQNNTLTGSEEAKTEEKTAPAEPGKAASTKDK